VADPGFAERLDGQRGTVIAFLSIVGVQLTVAMLFGTRLMDRRS
jgi:hypothetical protein